MEGPNLSINNPKYKLSQLHQSHLENYKKQEKERKKEVPKIYKEGDYYKDNEVSGVIRENGIQIDLDAWNDESKPEELVEWSNLNLRHGLAVSSIVKVAEIKASTYFNKDKLNFMNKYLGEHQPNVLYVNTILTVTQKRNIEK